MVVRPARDPRIPFCVLRPLLESVTWRMTLETGSEITGQIDPQGLEVLDERSIDDLHFARLALPVPEDVPTGYHRLRLETVDGQPLGVCRLIVAPERCYEPETMAAGERLWGLAVQLYSVRSRRNWGRGCSGLGWDIFTILCYASYR